LTKPAMTIVIETSNLVGVFEQRRMQIDYVRHDSRA
jgi:hypothetical protein